MTKDKNRENYHINVAFARKSNFIMVVCISLSAKSIENRETTASLLGSILPTGQKSILPTT
jgi:hypothetical protein